MATEARDERVELLVVEDSGSQARALRALLEERGYRVRVAADGVQALDELAAALPDIVLTDVVMPRMGGYELCQAIKADRRTRSIPVVMVTHLAHPKDVLAGLEAGADHFVTKPYRPDALVAKLEYVLENKRLRSQAPVEDERTNLDVLMEGQRHTLTPSRIQMLDLLVSAYDLAVQKNAELDDSNRRLRAADADLKSINGRLEETVRERTAELERTVSKLRTAMNGVVGALAYAVESRDPYTAGHQRRVSDLARTMASLMGLAEERIDCIRLAGQVHDIGKLSVPAELLSKPTRLSPAEFNIIQEHAQVGYEILKNVDFPWSIADVVRQHHERLDGKGYPQGLQGEQILLEARILGVADVVEAMASHRPYRAALGIDVALDEIQAGRGVRYDEKVVDACLAAFRDKGYQFKK